MFFNIRAAVDGIILSAPASSVALCFRNSPALLRQRRWRGCAPQPKPGLLKVITFFSLSGARFYLSACKAFMTRGGLSRRCSLDNISGTDR